MHIVVVILEEIRKCIVGSIVGLKGQVHIMSVEGPPKQVWGGGALNSP